MGSKNQVQRYLVNGEINVPRVQLISSESKMVGEFPTSVALNLARDADLDLVLMNADAEPPIAKIIDYSKFMYREQQKEKKTRASKAAQEVKEVRIRPKTGEHDLEVKAKAAAKFLEKGHPLKITVLLRGRENSRKADAKEFLTNFAKRLEEHGTVIGKPSTGGQAISINMNPHRKES